MRQVDCHDDTSVHVSRAAGEIAPALVVPGIATHSVTAANGRVYQLYVHLPPGYSESNSTSYPVLYLTDAETEVMAMYVGIANFLRITQRIRDVILVGIADGDVGVHGSLRRLDYTPTRLPANSTTSGGADEFLDFVHAVAMPLIDDVYRTDASDRGLWGYSFGGALAAHALLNRPGMFQRYVMASPSVAWDDRLLVKQARAYAADNDAYASSGDAAATRIYTAHGADELPANIEAWRAFTAALGTPAFSGLSLSTELVAGADHGTVMPIAFMRGLIAMYATESR